MWVVFMVIGGLVRQWRQVLGLWWTGHWGGTELAVVVVVVVGSSMLLVVVLVVLVLMLDVCVKVP